MTVISERLSRCGFLSALFLLTMLAVPQPAIAADCGQTMVPLITVRAPVRPATYDLSRGIADLSSDRNVAVPRGLEDFKYAFGATAAATEHRANWELFSRQSSDGALCWSVNNIQVTITVRTKVYIAKEVPRDSCLWRDINAHEAKHVRMDQKLFPRLSDAVRAKIVRQVSREIAAGRLEEANALWGQIINDATDAAAGEFRQLRNDAQLSIDTREEYTHANRVCGNAEIAAALQRAGLL